MAARLGLPHRAPFVFIRELVACKPGQNAECKTCFESTDPMFRGHFPGNPLVPGVILTEALAQTAGIVAASGFPEDSRPLFFLSAIRKMKFSHPVRPEQELVLRAEKLAQMGDLLQFKVLATTDGANVAQGELVLNAVSPAGR
jgi:3-hydroxyacyl-[acyl-carrier-protein] dehydratase